MTLQRVRIEAVDRNAARSLHGALAEIVVPPPSAVSLFEDSGGWTIDAYYPESPDLEELHEQLAAALGALPPDLQSTPVPPENWTALSQAALHPITAGRFTVHGSHDRGRVVRGPNSIEIDAGEAFGTGHHATTESCLFALDRVAHRRWRTPISILDLGCGSGVLGIAAARALPCAQVDAVDNDPIAVSVTSQNARINGVGERVRAAVANGIPRAAERRSERGYDVVLANILAGPLIKLAPSVSRATSVGGFAILSGILVPEAAAVLAAYRAQGFALIAHRRLEGWSTLTLLRRRSNAPGHSRRARRGV